MFQLLEDMNGHEPCDKRQASRPEATVETPGNLDLVGVAGAFLAIDTNCAQAKSQWRRSFRQSGRQNGLVCRHLSARSRLISIGLQSLLSRLLLIMTSTNGILIESLEEDGKRQHVQLMDHR